MIELDNDNLSIGAMCSFEALVQLEKKLKAHSQGWLDSCACHILKGAAELIERCAYELQWLQQSASSLQNPENEFSTFITTGLLCLKREVFTADFS
jgi:hypothetical protein